MAAEGGNFIKEIGGVKRVITPEIATKLGYIQPLSVGETATILADNFGKAMLSEGVS